ncbi:RNA polymerase sigma factor [Paenibacillus septentrionalis]|uniref:RNA polymerase sigma factor n=1 Tax=Paenibacillus septentrionalis TaxID=429342 RepID=UPI0036D37E38
MKMRRGIAYEIRLLHVERRESEINEQEWISKIFNGGAAAYKDFVNAYYEHVYRTAYAVLHHHQDAEDVAQEVFVQIYRALPEYRNQGLKTWITRITVNRAIDARRKLGRQRVTVAPDHDDIQLQADDQWSEQLSTEHQVLKQERKAMIREELKQLPEHYREVIQSFYIEEKSYEEIATQQGLEKKSVESRLYRARLWLKRHWRKEDFE